MKCEICGKEIEKSRYGNAVLCSSECFTKYFWNEIVQHKKDRIIINGNCYVDGGDEPQCDYKSWLGFDGQRYYIRFFDGREITTNNLWLNGTVPPEYREQLPDNAEFIWKKSK